MDPDRPVQILLVEDEAPTARILAQMLREDGFGVEIIADGALAVGRLARPPRPDVLIADLRLPHVDGVAIARYARSLAPEMPIILTTSYLTQALAAGRELSPPPAVLGKPYDYKRLSAELTRLLPAKAS